MQHKKHEQARYYNKSAKDLPGLKTGDAAYVRLVMNAQSNGQAECFVRTIKNSLTKAMEGGEDLHLVILSYITTPLNHSLSSLAELLNSRKFRCLLPLQTQ